MLQTRVAQRGGRAAVRIAVDLVDEGTISEQDAVERINEEQLEAARAPRFADAAPEADVIARGLASSPGGAVGEAAFDAARAQAMAEEGRKVVLIRPTTSPTDVQGFISSVAVVTGKGGRTSHAAVVARGMGRPAVCGIGEVEVLDGGRAARIAGVEMAEGTEIAVDGDRGIVSRSAPPFADVAEDPYVTKLSAIRGQAHEASSDPTQALFEAAQRVVDEHGWTEATRSLAEAARDAGAGCRPTASDSALAPIFDVVETAAAERVDADPRAARRAARWRRSTSRTIDKAGAAEDPHERSMVVPHHDKPVGPDDARAPAAAGGDLRQRAGRRDRPRWPPAPGPRARRGRPA